MKKQTSEVISGEGLVKYVRRVLNLGLDVHYWQVTVAMQEDGGRIKSAGKMGHPEFLNWVLKKLEEGWEIYSCYWSLHNLGDATAFKKRANQGRAFRHSF